MSAHVSFETGSVQCGLLSHHAPASLFVVPKGKSEGLRSNAHRMTLLNHIGSSEEGRLCRVARSRASPWLAAPRASSRFCGAAADFGESDTLPKDHQLAQIAGQTFSDLQSGECPLSSITHLHPRFLAMRELLGIYYRVDTHQIPRLRYIEKYI